MTAPRDDSVRQVIFNADDLGRTVGINEGIFHAHRRGVVSSATLMVNYATSAHAAARLNLHPELGVGLHVALTGGRPVSPVGQISSLVDGDGDFAAHPEQFDDLDPTQVEIEVGAQHRRFVKLVGREPTHLDSHHHSHRHPVVFRAVIALARRIGCPVRCCDAAMRSLLQEESVATTDWFDERFFDEGVSLESLRSILVDCPPGISEVMCHPGRVDDELVRGSSYVKQRERELDVLCSDQAFAALTERSIERVTFARVPPAN